MKPYALEAGPLAPQGEEEERMSILVKSGEFKKTMIWHVEDKLLYYKQRWYVSSEFLCWKLLCQHHDDLWAGHFGPCKMLELLQYHYYWPQMSTEI